MTPRAIAVAMLLCCSAARADGNTPDGAPTVALRLDYFILGGGEVVEFLLLSDGTIFVPSDGSSRWATTKLDARGLDDLWRRLPTKALAAVPRKFDDDSFNDGAELHLTAADRHLRGTWSIYEMSLVTEATKAPFLPMRRFVEVLGAFRPPSLRPYRPSRISIWVPLAAKDWPARWPIRLADPAHPFAAIVCLDGAELNAALQYAATHADVRVEIGLPLDETTRRCNAAKP